MELSPSAQSSRSRDVREGPRAAGGLPPGPTLPSIVQSGAWVFRPIPFLHACRERYGHTFTMRFAALPPIVLLSRPSDIKEVFTGDPDVFHAGSANLILKPILGRSSLLLLDGDRHMRERRLMMPSFHGERMHAYGRVMEEAADRAIDAWPLGDTFAIHHAMQEITLDVIVRAVFGITDAKRHDALRRALVDMLAFGERPALLLLIGADGELRWRETHERLGRLSPWAGFKRTIGEVDALLEAEVSRRRALREEQGADVLSMLLAARDEEGGALSDEQLVDEMKTLLVAGHETSATGLTWTLLELLRHPEVLMRLREDLAEGRDDYLDAVVKESLRLHPIVPMVGRRLQASAVVGGREYPEGSLLAPSIYLTHRNPATWREPDRFDPSRFLGLKPSPYEYLPFGGGVRRCIGLAFAMFEMKRVLRRIIERTDLTLARGYRPELVRRGITFAVSEGLPVVLARRVPAPTTGRA